MADYETKNEKDRLYEKIDDTLTNFETDVIDNKKFASIGYHAGRLYVLLSAIRDNWTNIADMEAE